MRITYGTVAIPKRQDDSGVRKTPTTAESPCGVKFFAPPACRSTPMPLACPTRSVELIHSTKRMDRVQHSEGAIEMLDLQFQPHGVSLPSPEDYGSPDSRRTPSSKKPGKRTIVWIVAILTATAVLIGTSVGVGVRVSRKQSSDEQSSDTAAFSDEFGGPSEASVIDWLAERQISDRSSLENSESPQHRAMQYLRNRSDPSLPSTGLDDRVAYEFAASYILAVLYYETKGEEWDENLDFLSEDDICEWTDVKPAFMDGGIGLENAGMICDPISGIPLVLDIEHNHAIGKIPTELGLLTTLEIMDLSFNGLTGPLPTELCQLTNLRHLEIGHNYFTGGLPTCLTELTNLSELIAPLCGLSGKLSEETLCEMTQLQNLILQYNNFEGSIPKCDGNDWPNLSTLHISDNFLTGPLPSELATLPSLLSLFLDDNELSGNPLGTVNQFVNLEELYIEGNSFSGVIDSTFANNLMRLRALDMSNNQLGGSVPSELFTLPELVVVDLSNNLLQGRLPTEVAVQDNMRFLSLFKNSITGPVPSGLANFRNLQYLDLANNKLTGDLNADVFAMPFLINIFMSENPGFTQGPVPEMVDMVNLKELSLKNTNRVGTLPTFENSTLMHLIDLGNNALTGTVPSNYGTFTNLGFLLLNRNPGLNGPLPTFSEPSILNTVLLDKTSIKGNFNSICNLPTFLGMIDIYEDIDPVVIADCGDADSGITCKCCKCCTKDQLTCSEPVVDSLNWTWENQLNNVARDFGVNHTLFPDSTNR